MGNKYNSKYLLYYPVYVNTYAVVDILKKDESTSDIDVETFNWDEVIPSTLQENIRAENHDLIYCFTSSEKKAYFKETVQDFIKASNSRYKVSKEVADARDENLKDIQSSKFFFRYIFFSDKVNIKQIQLLTTVLYGNVERESWPYLTKLTAFLLARGYQTIEIDSDASDEGKGLLRKLLYEEYGFKFKLIPASSFSYRENTVLIIEAKGGQQSFEEVGKINDKKSSKIVFQIPEKEKFSSNTDIVILYKDSNNDEKCNITHIENTRKIASEILTQSKKKLLSDDVAKDFIKANLNQVIYELEKDNNNIFEKKIEKLFKQNSFLKSLKSYKIESEITDLIKKLFISRNETQFTNTVDYVINQANSLYIINKSKFINCLENHHLGKSLNNVINLKGDAISKFRRLFIFMYGSYFNESQDTLLKVQDTLLKGMTLLRVILSNPDGNIGNFEVEAKRIKEEIASSINEPPSTWDSKLNDFYHTIRIVAEDLNFLIEEGSWGNPKDILSKELHGLDVSEFEYLFSIDFAKRFLIKF